MIMRNQMSKTIKCDDCVFARLVTSENGKHPVCVRDEEEARKCIMGVEDQYIKHPAR